MDLSTDEKIVLSKQYPIKYKGANTKQIDCISTWDEVSKVPVYLFNNNSQEKLRTG